MNVAIVGSRDYVNVHLVRAYVLALDHTDTVVSSHGGNVDLTAEDAAIDRHIGGGTPKPIIFEADWRTHGDPAGPMRNSDIARACDRLVAFRMPGISKGTDDVIRKARRFGKPYVVFGPEGDEVERWSPPMKSLFS